MKAILTAALLLFVATTAATAFGPDPASIPGSFHRSCSACRVDQFGYLGCTCTDEYHGSISTLLRLRYCASGHQIENISGNLQCFPIVRGSWGASCRDAYIRGRTLNYTCSTGSDVDTTRVGIFDLDTCPSMEFQNLGGHLRCLK